MSTTVFCWCWILFNFLPPHLFQPYEQIHYLGSSKIISRSYVKLILSYCFLYLSKNSINKVDTFKEMSQKNYNGIQFQNLKKDQTVSQKKMASLLLSHYEIHEIIMRSFIIFGWDQNHQCVIPTRNNLKYPLLSKINVKGLALSAQVKTRHFGIMYLAQTSQFWVSISDTGLLQTVFQSHS